MALNLIGQFYIQSGASGIPSGDYQSGRIVKAFWDDVSLSVKVHVFLTDGTDVGEQSSGPTIFYSFSSGRWRNEFEKFEFKNFGYKFCDGTTLKSFFMPQTASQPNPFVFPYVRTVNELNHWSCAVNVCDILFDTSSTVVTADTGASDGTISVVASSSLSDVRFSLTPDFAYADGVGANTHTFTGLAAGNYTIYAADDNLCRAQLNVTVTLTEDVYSVRWRMEYNDEKITGASANRVDIEELNYSGAIEEVKGGETPFAITWRGESNEDIFNPIVSSEVEINLVSETNYQFLDLFTGDDRKYRVRYYKDTGSGLEERWRGFVVPMIYNEPYYIEYNYIVSITASDQLANLSSLDFADDFNNIINQRISCLSAICTILRKTDVDINIWECINLYDTQMDSTSSDSALDQAYIDTYCYIDNNGIPAKCNEVLGNILLSFGARLYQADGMWRIDLIEQKAGTLNYRIFNLNGTLQSSGSQRDLITVKTSATETQRAMWTNRSATLSIMPFYNTINFIIDTKFENNLLTSGKFEENDIVSNQIRGWGFDLTNGAGITYGLEKIEERSGSQRALFIDFSNTITSGSEIILTAEEFVLQPIVSLALKLKLDVLFRPWYKEFFSYIDVSLGIGGDYISGQSNYNTLSPGEKWVRIYVDDPLKWNTIELIATSSFRGANQEIAGPVILKIRASNNPMVDYASITALKAQAVSTAYPRVKVNDGGTLRIYKLTNSTEAEDSPNIIRPDVYTTKLWQLENSYDLPDEDYVLAGVLIDNVILAIDSDFSLSPSNRRNAANLIGFNPSPYIQQQLLNPDFENFVIVSESFNPRVKIDFSRDLVHTDYTVREQPGISPENYIRLTKAYFSLQNGTPTELWGRVYSTEEKELIDILMDMYKAQIITPSYKLSGSLISDLYPSFLYSFYDQHLGKYFLPTYLRINDKANTFDAELLELKTGTNGEAPNPDVYEFTEEFTTEFNA